MEQNFLLYLAKIKSVKTITVDAVILWLQCQLQLSYQQTTIFENASLVSAYKYFFVWNNEYILLLSGILTISRNNKNQFEQNENKTIKKHCSVIDIIIFKDKRKTISNRIIIVD